MPPELTCPRCKGKGHLQLTKTYHKCLATIKSLGQPTINEIHERSGNSHLVTATNKRVERLINWRLVRRVGEGRPMRVECV